MFFNPFQASSMSIAWFTPSSYESSELESKRQKYLSKVRCHEVGQSASKKLLVSMGRLRWQTNNCEVAREYSDSQGKHPKVETTKQEPTQILYQNCHLYGFKDRKNVSSKQRHYLMKGWDFKSSSGRCLPMALRHRFAIKQRPSLCKTKISLLYSVQTGPGGHPGSCPIDAGGVKLTTPSI
jgi:hypothetical protein